MAELVYQRILLKLSGESLAGKGKFGIDFLTLNRITKDIQKVHKLGVQIGIVIGGGNIFRGVDAQEQGLDRVSSDYMGMLATTINSLALQNAFEKLGLKTRIQTAVEMSKVAEPYIRRKSIRHLEKGRLVIFAAGTGNPYFSTDTAAALRALEIGANVLLKATRVDGIYDKDPLKNKEARLFKKISYIDVLKHHLKIMDSTAISLCMDNKIPVRAFNMNVSGNLLRILNGKNIGTLVHP